MTIAILFAAVVLFIVATLIGPARRMGKEIATLIGKSVRIVVWGQELPATTIESVVTIGAGINMKAGGSQFKIAQPKGFSRSDGRIEIAYARYVQFDRKRLPHGTGPAVVFFF